MSIRETQSPSKRSPGIAVLVARARAEGHADAFFGKRRWKRYRLGLQLEVTKADEHSDEAWPVVMHNVSGGGFGFWSKRRLHQGDEILVRERTGSCAGEALRATITHCTVGIQGYLIGAAFDDPCEPDERTSENRQPTGEKPVTEAETNAARGRRKPASLAIGWIAFGAGSASLGASAILVAQRTYDGPFPAWLTATVLAGAALAATLMGWFYARRDTRFLSSLQSAVSRMGSGSTEPLSLLHAPSSELDGLRRALFELETRWRRRAHDERAQRQKLEEITQIKSNILSIVSHDLRTPLTSILLYAQMLHEELGTLSNTDQRRFLGIISEECTRLSRLVDDLLEVQRLESDRTRWDMRPQDLSDTIRACGRVFEALAASKSIDFTVDCPDALPTAEVDADKMSQVVSNLLSNAMKFTPTHGRVHLSVAAPGPDILIRVADTGPGIPRDKWDQIFDRFSQLSDPNTSQIDGVGLGLYIVKRIVECHAGTTWVDSAEPGGSEFCVSLPIREAGRPIPAMTRKGVSAGRVLVCDPDPELAAVVAQTLRWDGYDVRVCHSGGRLLAQLAHSDADVVLTDVLLPDMNATQVLDALGSRDDRSFGLIVHSYAGEDGELAQRGVDRFLQRPVGRDELCQAVGTLMRQAGSEPGLRVLLVGMIGDASVRLPRFLAERGHIVVVRDILEEVAAAGEGDSFDVILVSQEAACGLPQDDTTMATLSRNIRSFVLCDPDRSPDVESITGGRIPTLPYKPGEESILLRRITASRPRLATETVS